MRSIRRGARGLAIAAAIAVIGTVLAALPIGAAFEQAVGLPWLFKTRGAVEAPAEVVVVGIDGTSGRALDLPKLPRDWSRTVHAQLVGRLAEGGAAVTVFDFDFSREKPGEDETFARAVAEAKEVVLLERLVGRRQPVQRVDGSDGGWIWIEETLPPAAPLALAARARGPFPLPKVDLAAHQFWTFKASARDAPTTVALALQLYALPLYERWRSLLEEAGAPGVERLPAGADQLQDAEAVRAAMRTLRAAFYQDPQLLERLRQALQGVAAPDERALLEALAAVYAGPEDRYLNFYGPPGTIRTVPYHQMMGDNGLEVAIGDLAGKVVFVGYSDLFDPEQPDRFYTVFTGRDGIDLSGVEIMATAFANLLTERALRPSGPGLTALIVLAFGLVIGVGVYLLPAMAAVPLALALAGLYAVGAQWAFNQAHLWLPLATPILVQLPLALLLGLMAQYLLERKREREMSRAISYYLPQHIVRDLVAGNLDEGALNKVVYGTCLATDMSGFSTIAESKTPDELATFMNAYFEALAQPLKRHHVDVTEFHADTIMCAWTAPEPRPAVRENALKAAIELVEEIERFSRADGSVALNPRIGLQDGHFYLGHTGGGGRMAYSILGDPANTAARLESLNKQLGTHLLAAGSVVEGVNGVPVRPLGTFQLVGKAEPVAVVEVLTRGNGADGREAELCALFADGLEAFQGQEWERAAALFEALLAAFPADGPAGFYFARCQQYLTTGAPADAPTVIRLDAK
jgi:adenylate cyclase